MPGRGAASAANAAGDAPKGSMPIPAWLIAASAGCSPSGGRAPGVLPGVPASGSIAASAAACCAALGGALADTEVAAGTAACACCWPSVGLAAARHFMGVVSSIMHLGTTIEQPIRVQFAETWRRLLRPTDQRPTHQRVAAAAASLLARLTNSARLELQSPSGLRAAKVAAASWQDDGEVR